MESRYAAGALLLEKVFLLLPAFHAPLSKPVGPKPQKGFSNRTTGTGHHTAEPGRALENKLCLLKKYGGVNGVSSQKTGIGPGFFIPGMQFSEVEKL